MIGLLFGAFFLASGLWEYRWLRHYRRVMEERPLNDSERPRYNLIRIRPHVFIPLGVGLIAFGVIQLLP